MMKDKAKALVAVALALCLGLLTACSSGPQAMASLSYDDIKGSGLANNCPQLSESDLDAIALQTNQPYQVKELCLQPTTFSVKRSPLIKQQESKFVAGKLLTRKSFTLDQVSGALKLDPSGNLTFIEQGGFDFQPVTVQMPDGERVPLLFTIKGLIASSQDQTREGASGLSPATRLAGTFQVPPYRTSSFIDPKGRGIAVGYDAAIGLPTQADSKSFARQNIKSFEVGEGQITLQINRVNRETGEISGRFESEQPADTDFGSKEPMAVKISGQFYGRIEQPLA